MNEVIIDEGMMDAIDLAAKGLWKHVRPSDEYGEGEGIYFIDECLCSIRDCGFSHVKVSGLVMGACRPLLQGLV